VSGNQFSRSIGGRLRELWTYRELIRNLVVRDLKVRYRNSVLGIVWSWANPLLMMLVFTVVFNFLFIRSDLEHYHVLDHQPEDILILNEVDRSLSYLLDIDVSRMLSARRSTQHQGQTTSENTSMRMRMGATA